MQMELRYGPLANRLRQNIRLHRRLGALPALRRHTGAKEVMTKEQNATPGAAHCPEDSVRLTVESSRPRELLTSKPRVSSERLETLIKIADSFDRDPWPDILSALQELSNRRAFDTQHVDSSLASKADSWRMVWELLRAHNPEFYEDGETGRQAVEIEIRRLQTVEQTLEESPDETAVPLTPSTLDGLLAEADKYILPVDVKIGAATFRKGVKVGTMLRGLKSHAERQTATAYSSEEPLRELSASEAASFSKTLARSPRRVEPTQTPENIRAYAMAHDDPDLFNSSVKPTRNQAAIAPSDASGQAPMPRGNLPNNLGTGGAGSYPAASSSEKAFTPQGNEFGNLLRRLNDDDAATADDMCEEKASQPTDCDCGTFCHASRGGQVLPLGARCRRASAKAACGLCTEGMNSFTDPDTGKKMHARNGVVTVCTSEKGNSPWVCPKCQQLNSAGSTTCGRCDDL